MGETESESIMRFPDDGGLLFNYVYGKTLKERHEARFLCAALRGCGHVPGYRLR